MAGGQNTAAIEDVEYIQKKLFAALKIPRAYLGYDEDVGAKATLAQEDIRFSRTIQRIQKTVIAELNKIAMIHLFCHGYDGEDLIDFELKLSNPSSVAQLQKLELISTRFDIAGKVPEGMLDRRWVQKNVLGLTDKVIEEVNEGRKEDKLMDADVESAGAPEGEGGAEGGDMGGGDEGGGLFAADNPEGELLTAFPGDGVAYDEEDEEDDDIDISQLSIDDPNAPLKAQSSVKKVFGKPTPGTKAKRGPLSTQMPDFKKMVTHSRPQDSLRKPYGEDYLRPAFEGMEWDERDTYDSMSRSVKPTMTPEMRKAMSSLSSILTPEGGVLLSEAAENEEESFDLDEYDTGDIDES